MPEAAPVTMAERPLMSNWSSVFMRVRLARTPDPHSNPHRVDIAPRCLGHAGGITDPTSPRAGEGKSQVELPVDRDAELAAATLVVVDEPPDVERLHELAVLVVEFICTLHPQQGLHSVRTVGRKGVGRARHLGDELAGAADPVIFEVAEAALEPDRPDHAAMLVGADHARRLDPEDVAIDVLADVEGKMPDRRIVAER